MVSLGLKLKMTVMQRFPFYPKGTGNSVERIFEGTVGLYGPGRGRVIMSEGGEGIGS